MAVIEDDLYDRRVEVQKMLDERFPQGVFLEVYSSIMGSQRKVLIRATPAGRVFCNWGLMPSGDQSNLWGLVFPGRTREVRYPYLQDAVKPWQCLWDGEFTEVQVFGRKADKFEPLTEDFRPYGFEVYLYPPVGDERDLVGRGVPPGARAVATKYYEEQFFPRGL